jgi:Zn finger protein HypA/HybF involved in hydrogenase expression
MKEEIVSHYIVKINCRNCGQPNSLTKDSVLMPQYCVFCSKRITKNPIHIVNGFVYILSNKFMPGILKIGFTERNIKNRIQELSNPTGVPADFEIEAYFPSNNPSDDEKAVHKLLSSYRLENKEFFRISVQESLNKLCDLFDLPPIISKNKIKTKQFIRWVQCKSCNHIWETDYKKVEDGNCPKCGWNHTRRIKFPSCY